MNVTQRHLPERVVDFSRLNGWVKNHIVVCEASSGFDRILFVTKVAAYRGSQPRTGMPMGFITFRNHTRFDIAHQSVDGVPVHIYNWNPGLQLLWDCQQLRDYIEDWVDSSSDIGDLVALADLVMERLALANRMEFVQWRDLPPAARSWVLARARQELAIHLLALGMGDLKELVAVLSTGSQLPAAA